MKKLTSILTAIVLILSITPTAFATVYTEGYLHYTISDESITITGYFGEEETVTIPAVIAGIPVNTIASGAFTGSGIKELNLPDTITGIESGAIDAGVVINYDSNLPSSGQEQPDPTQPNPPQLDSPPDTEDRKETQQPPQGESQPTKPAQPDDSKPQPSQTNPSGQPAVTTSTEPANAIEEVEVELEETEVVPASPAIEEAETELAPEETERVTTSPAEEIPDSTKETEAAAEAVTEPAESAAPKPAAAGLAAAAAAAVLALGGVLVWKKKK